MNFKWFFPRVIVFKQGHFLIKKKTYARYEILYKLFKFCPTKMKTNGSFDICFKVYKQNDINEDNNVSCLVAHIACISAHTLRKYFTFRYSVRPALLETILHFGSGWGLQ